MYSHDIKSALILLLFLNMHFIITNRIIFSLKDKKIKLFKINLKILVSFLLNATFQFYLIYEYSAWNGIKTYYWISKTIHYEYKISKMYYNVENVGKSYLSCRVNTL